MRFTLALLALIVALTLPAGASAAFLPVETPARADGAMRASSRGTPVRLQKVSVLVGLRQAPLARRGPVGAADTRSLGARAQLSAIAREQARAEAELAEKIPQARVLGRHTLLLNALAVELPAGQTSRLAELASAATSEPKCSGPEGVGAKRPARDIKAGDFRG